MNIIILILKVYEYYYMNEYIYKTMPGGLLNLVAYGNQNIILNGKPKEDVSLNQYILAILILECKSFV